MTDEKKEIEDVGKRMQKVLTMLSTTNQIFFLASMHADGSAEYGSFLGSWLVGFFEQARKLDPSKDSVNTAIMERACAATLLKLMRDMHGIPTDEVVQLSKDVESLSEEQTVFIHPGTDEVQ